MTQLKGKLWQQLENDLVNGKPKEKKKSIPLVKFESTFDAYLYDKHKDTAGVKEQPKTERGYGLASLFRIKV